MAIFINMISERKYTIALLTCLLVFSAVSFGQSDSLYKVIEKKGLAFVKPIKQGQIQGMKHSNPPKNTWTYAALEAYKKALDNGDDIVYGSFIHPSAKEGEYGFNFYALTKDASDVHYFFVAIISYKIVNGAVVKSDPNYLFTEKTPLKQWWSSSYSNCLKGNTLQNSNSLNIPCPPPPFKE